MELVDGEWKSSSGTRGEEIRDEVERCSDALDARICRRRRLSVACEQRHWLTPSRGTPRPPPPSTHENDGGGGDQGPTFGGGVGDDGTIGAGVDTGPSGGGGGSPGPATFGPQCDWIPATISNLGGAFLPGDVTDDTDIYAQVTNDAGEYGWLRFCPGDLVARFRVAGPRSIRSISSPAPPPVPAPGCRSPTPT